MWKYVSIKYKLTCPSLKGWLSLQKLFLHSGGKETNVFVSKMVAITALIYLYTHPDFACRHTKRFVNLQ
jgi:hypothetical protein